MVDFKEMGEPTYVSRDAGYNMVEYLKNKSKNNHNYGSKNSKYVLKEIFSQMGVVVIPDKLSYLFEVFE